MNSKGIFKKYLNGFLIINKNVFDYQIFHLIKCEQKKPDLKPMVRLFFKCIPPWSLLFMDMKKQFGTYHVLDNEVRLGSNRINYEIRLYFYQTEELPQKVILCFAISHLNIMGYFQSLYFRFIFLFLLPSIVKLMGNRLTKTIPTFATNQ
jgi:hypothetical protein